MQSVFGGSHGIYLDDAVSGIEITGNILYDTDGLATMNGGGRDNIVRNNILVNTKGGHETDMCGLQFANFDFNGEESDSWNLLGWLNVDLDSFNDYYPLIPIIDYQHDIWATYYPEMAAIPNNWNQVSNSHWLEPEGNVFSCNVSWNVETLFVEATTGGSGALSHYAEISNNLETDPLFMDEVHLNMNLQPNSPAFSLPCFLPIPFNSIGILETGKMTYMPLVLNH